MLNKTLTILVPMAGLGSRFANAGWNIPKPFIPVRNQMMVEWVLSGLTVNPSNLVLVMRESFKTEHMDCVDKLLAHFPASVEYTRKTTQGAACTALAARNRIDDNPLVIVDSDTYLRPPVFQNFIEDALERQLEVSILTMAGDNPAFSYVKTDPVGRIQDMAEKKVISNNAVCGTYFFSTPKIFIDSILDLLIYGDTTKNEYYMSQVCINAIINFNALGGIFKANNSDIICMGTPSQLEDAIHII